MKREGQEARNLAKQARKRRDFSAEAMHKRNARARECAMERLNKEAATPSLIRRTRYCGQSHRDSKAMRTKLSLWC
jgi:hypothetical protein